MISLLKLFKRLVKESNLNYYNPSKAADSSWNRLYGQQHEGGEEENDKQMDALEDILDQEDAAEEEFNGGMDRRYNNRGIGTGGWR